MILSFVSPATSGSIRKQYKLFEYFNNNNDSVKVTTRFTQKGLIR
jgi:hypothetical protein